MQLSLKVSGSVEKTPSGIFESSSLNHKQRLQQRRESVPEVYLVCLNNPIVLSTLYLYLHRKCGIKSKTWKGLSARKHFIEWKVDCGCFPFVVLLVSCALKQSLSRVGKHACALCCSFVSSYIASTSPPFGEPIGDMEHVPACPWCRQGSTNSPV